MFSFIPYIQLVTLPVISKCFWLILTISMAEILTIFGKTVPPSPFAPHLLLTQKKDPNLCCWIIKMILLIF